MHEKNTYKQKTKLINEFIGDEMFTDKLIVLLRLSSLLNFL